MFSMLVSGIIAWPIIIIGVIIYAIYSKHPLDALTRMRINGRCKKRFWKAMRKTRDCCKALDAYEKAFDRMIIKSRNWYTTSYYDEMWQKLKDEGLASEKRMKKRLMEEELAAKRAEKAKNV